MLRNRLNALWGGENFMSHLTRANAGSLKMAALALALSSGLTLSACNSTANVLSHGYQLNEDTLALVPEGASREQVQLAFGTPSTKQGQPDGSETYYYISQKKKRPVAFAKARVVDQRIMAVYLGTDGTVQRIANYGLKEGKVFDYVRRVTPTGGRDLTFLGQLLRAAGSASPAGVLNRS